MFSAGFLSGGLSRVQRHQKEQLERTRAIASANTGTRDTLARFDKEHQQRAKDTRQLLARFVGDTRAAVRGLNERFDKDSQQRKKERQQANKESKQRARDTRQLVARFHKEHVALGKQWTDHLNELAGARQKGSRARPIDLSAAEKAIFEPPRKPKATKTVAQPEPPPKVTVSADEGALPSAYKKDW